MASQLKAPIGRVIRRSKAKPRIRSSGRILPVLSHSISLTPPKQATHTIALIPKVERRASVHPSIRTEWTTCEPSPLRQPRMKSVAKNSSRDIKPLSCLDKLRFSSEMRAVESISLAVSANNEHAPALGTGLNQTQGCDLASTCCFPCCHTPHRCARKTQGKKEGLIN